MGYAFDRNPNSALRQDSRHKDIVAQQPIRASAYVQFRHEKQTIGYSGGIIEYSFGIGESQNILIFIFHTKCCFLVNALYQSDILFFPTDSCLPPQPLPSITDVSVRVRVSTLTAERLFSCLSWLQEHKIKVPKTEHDINAFTQYLIIHKV